LSVIAYDVLSDKSKPTFTINQGHEQPHVPCIGAAPNGAGLCTQDHGIPISRCVQLCQSRSYYTILCYTWYMGKQAPIYRAGRASACSLALLDGHFHKKWTHSMYRSIVGTNFFIKKREERKGGGKERALVYWLTLLHLFVSCLYVVTTTLSGKLVKVAISNEEVPSSAPGRSCICLAFCRSTPTLLIATKI
jgi:hypothetical protein